MDFFNVNMFRLGLYKECTGQTKDKFLLKYVLLYLEKDMAFYFSDLSEGEKFLQGIHLLPSSKKRKTVLTLVCPVLISHFSNSDISQLKEGSPPKKMVIKTKEEKRKPAIVKEKLTPIDNKVNNLKKKESSVSPVPDRINIVVENASKQYLKNLKTELNELEGDKFTIEQFRRDIADNKFVQRAVEAHEEALKFKLDNYTKLHKLDWSTAGEDKNSNGINTNMSERINNIIITTKSTLRTITANPLPMRISDKRKKLLSILEDPDNGIITIRGKSREDVRTMMIKIIYMFLKVPSFFFKGFINFMVTGPAGSGKTKVAGSLAHMFKTLGILSTDKVVMATKQNFVGQFIGQSGPKTRSTLASALEGVVFIDEAYSLTPCPGESTNNNFSEEAVAELINFMDKFIGCMVIIVAGYKDKMYNCFMTFNEGMMRRFPRTIDFVQYSGQDMIDLFTKFANESVKINDILSKNSRSYVKGIISTLNDNEVFTNQAGDMLNLAKMITEDAMLYGDEYVKNRINMSFKKFLASKNLAINFS